MRPTDKRTNTSTNLQTELRILTNFSSKSGPNFSLEISTKLKPQSLDQSSASKSQQNFGLKKFTKIPLQNLDQTLAIIGAYQH